MATKEVDTGKLVKETLDELQKHHQAEYRQFIGREKEISKIIQDTIISEIKLTEEMSKFVDAENLEEMEKTMSAIISPERTRMVKDAFSIETYKMTIEHTSGSKPEVFVHCEGQQFREPLQITAMEHVIISRILQIGSVLIEAVLLVLNAIGLKVEINARLMNRIIGDIEPVLRSSAFQRAMNKFIQAWNAGGNWKKAKAIFFLLKDTYALGIFWTIVKALLSNMSAWDYIKSIAEITAMIIAAFATDGIALIAKIALALNSAYNFIKKIANLDKLEKIERSL